jgi:hypothetical protein
MCQAFDQRPAANHALVWALIKRRITMHARIRLGMAAAVMLSSCGDPSLSEKQRDEVTDIAGDAAPDISALESRIDELEGELEAVKHDADRVEDIDSRLSDVESVLRM